ncbi:MAG: TIGR00282 family metallophosphoesterase [Verrucomicrobiia bacterium]
MTLLESPVGSRKKSFTLSQRKYQPDFVVINGENAAGGNGITSKLAIELMRYGADVITLGDHVWDQKEVVSYFETEPRLLRPFNYPKGTPGKGHVVVQGNGKKLGVINAQGRTFIKPELDNPFLLIEPIIEEIKKETNCILVDFHAEATSEKIAFGRFLDGKVSAVVGTHTHVATADEEIFSKGTAYQTDVGMCGAHDSVIGREAEGVIQRYLTLLPQRWYLSQRDIRINGTFIEVDETSGLATQIERIQFRERKENAP